MVNDLAFLWDDKLHKLVVLPNILAPASHMVLGTSQTLNRYLLNLNEYLELLVEYSLKCSWSL